MKTTNRSYEEELGDFDRLSRFMVDHDRYLRDYSTWCLGRLVDWKYNLYEHKRTVPNFCHRNAQLWFDAFQRLAGMVISEEGDANFAIVTLAGYRFLFDEMLHWVLTNWGDRGPNLSIEITTLQEMEAERLESAGFQRKASCFTWKIDLTQAPDPRSLLPDGFTIVDMAAHPDFLAQRVLRDEAFRGKTGASEAELQQEILFYNHSHHGPIYHPQTDLCVMAPDGRFVSGCEALIDARNNAADIERVCTHSGFRRRGFARAVILECLHRLRTMGLHTAYITGYSQAAIALYASFGSSSAVEAYIFERQAGPPQG